LQVEGEAKRVEDSDTKILKKSDIGGRKFYIISQDLEEKKRKSA